MDKSVRFMDSNLAQLHNNLNNKLNKNLANYNEKILK